MTHWKTNKNATIGIKDVQNRKNVKYMEQILNQFQKNNNLQNGLTKRVTGKAYNQDQVQVTRIQFDYLQTLYKIAKASKAYSLDMYIQDDQPMTTILYNKRKRGGKKYQQTT